MSEIKVITLGLLFVGVVSGGLIALAIWGFKAIRRKMDVSLMAKRQN